MLGPPSPRKRVLRREWPANPLSSVKVCPPCLTNWCCGYCGGSTSIWRSYSGITWRLNSARHLNRRAVRLPRTQLFTEPAKGPYVAIVTSKKPQKMRQLLAYQMLIVGGRGRQSRLVSVPIRRYFHRSGRENQGSLLRPVFGVRSCGRAVCPVHPAPKADVQETGREGRL